MFQCFTEPQLLQKHHKHLFYSKFNDVLLKEKVWHEIFYVDIDAH